MSDGAPTTIGRADRQGEWWNGISNADWWGDNNQAWSANGFMPLLMASYMKNAVSEHYYGADATQTRTSTRWASGINHSDR